MGREGNALCVRGKVAPVHPFVHWQHRSRGTADVRHSGGDNVVQRNLEGGPHGSPLQHLHKTGPVSLRDCRQLERENSSHLFQQPSEIGILCRWVSSTTLLGVCASGGVEGCRYLPRLHTFCLTPDLPTVTLHRGCMGQTDSRRTRLRRGCQCWIRKSDSRPRGRWPRGWPRSTWLRHRRRRCRLRRQSTRLRHRGLRRRGRRQGSQARRRRQRGLGGHPRQSFKGLQANHHCLEKVPQHWVRPVPGMVSVPTRAMAVASRRLRACQDLLPRTPRGVWGGEPSASGSGRASGSDSEPDLTTAEAAPDPVGAGTSGSARGRGTDTAPETDDPASEAGAERFEEAFLGVIEALGLRNSVSRSTEDRDTPGAGSGSDSAKPRDPELLFGVGLRGASGKSSWCRSTLRFRARLPMV
ncbi:uncharacterized protein LOC135358266 [Latimeria chalumnae]|uniref:uncharacterized protein LOC135358266 n=1 Tax=Latimeria chalumnae TaxID=7897 RepID=UPI00313A7FA0